MKSSDEAINALFLRRDQYFANKVIYRKRKIKAGVSLVVIVCVLSVMYGRTMQKEITKSDAPEILVDSAQHPVSAIASNDAERNSDAEIIVINELESIPMLAEINYPVGDFAIMTRDEVLSYFYLQMRPEEMLPELDLTEVNTVHGFYSTEAGEVFPYDHFIFIDENKDINIDISLQLKGIPQVVLCQTDYFIPRQSQIAGKPVCIYHWKVDSVDYYYAEFMTETGVGIAIQTQNTETNSICSLVKYFLNQNRIVVIEVQPNTIEKD